jgi:hypothetical protein
VFHRLAEILGRHAATVFKTMSGLEPDRLEIIEAEENEGPRYPLGVKVDFHSLKDRPEELAGFFVCAFKTSEAAKEIASVIAGKLGLSGALAKSERGVDDILGEFLNIVIGLTCSDWADHGLITEFEPPQPLINCQFDSFPPLAKAYHLTMSSLGHPDVSIFLVFFNGNLSEGQ